jgi:hypothetical protein
VSSWKNAIRGDTTQAVARRDLLTRLDDKSRSCVDTFVLNIPPQRTATA